MTLQPLKTPFPITAHYLGEETVSGPLPTLFYFALSSVESLTEPPFSSPLLPLQDIGLRIISFSLPFHTTPESKFDAMKLWASEISAKSAFLDEYIDCASKAIEWLIEQQFVRPDRMALAGLSRGGFIATHLAAREKRFETLLGLAPLTTLSYLEEFKPLLEDQALKRIVEQLDCLSLTEKLLHLRSLRFYIGNRDERVSTDCCYQFIRALANTAFEKHQRHANIELQLTQSIGHKGHGTSQATFHEAGLWLKSKLL